MCGFTINIWNCKISGWSLTREHLYALFFKITLTMNIIFIYLVQNIIYYKTHIVYKYWVWTKFDFNTNFLDFSLNQLNWRLNWNCFDYQSSNLNTKKLRSCKAKTQNKNNNPMISFQSISKSQDAIDTMHNHTDIILWFFLFLRKSPIVINTETNFTKIISHWSIWLESQTKAKSNSRQIKTNKPSLCVYKMVTALVHRSFYKISLYS